MFDYFSINMNKQHLSLQIFSYCVFILNLCLVNSSRESKESKVAEAPENGDLSEREVFDSAIFFTTRTTVLTTTTEVYFNMNAPVGPLYNFIVNICKILINNFSYSRRIEYFEILSRSLKHLGSGRLMRKLVNRFSKHLHKLSAYVYKGERLEVLVNNFLNIVTANKPKKNALFSALNAIYTTSHDRKMDDYLYQLKRYGTDKINHIERWTRKIFSDVIFYTISKQKEPVKDDILMKFIQAVMEYREIEIHSL